MFALNSLPSSMKIDTEMLKGLGVSLAMGFQALL